MTSLAINEPFLNNKKVNSPTNRSSKKRDSINKNINTSIISTQQDHITYPSDFFTELRFSWSVNALRTANHTPLKLSHLGKVGSKYTATTSLNSILPQWLKFQKNKSSYPWFKSLISTNLLSIIKFMSLSIIVAGMEITMIILFRQILLHFDSNSNKHDTYFSLLNTALIMLGTKFVYTFIQRYYEFFATVICSQTTIQINSLLYDKLWKISAFNRFSEGALINFIQIDSEKFSDFFSYSPGTLVLPFQISFYIYLLFQYFGPSFIIGMLLLLLILSTVSCLENVRMKYQKEYLRLKDRRTKTTAQVFEMIKIVKLYSWEEYFKNKVSSERKEEIEMLRKIQIVTMISNSLFWSTSALVSLISIIIFNVFDSQMDIANILTSIYIFNNLSEPLFIFPEHITGLVNSFISLNRIEKFLNGKEWNREQVDRSGNNVKTNNKKYAITIENMDFGLWSNSKKNSSSPTNVNKFNRESIESIHVQQHHHHNSDHQIILLHNITFRASYGGCIGIVGEFGSGKTCLLNSILNNLDILNNQNKDKKIIINGTISYIAQNPWILNDTLRNNILFFKDFDEDKYNRIIDICELTKDFQLLNGGDFTEIGDKGINLSGGQKARISIARALYSDSDIYWFDDPLSALDAEVGMQIFNRVILEYLKSKTCIVVTNAWQYVPLMSDVYQMKEGSIIWSGTGEEAVKMEFYSRFCKPIKKKKLSDHEPLNELCDTEVDSRNRGKTIEVYNKTKKKNVHRLIKDESDHEMEVSKYKTYIKIFSYVGGSFFISLICLINIFWKTSEFSSEYLLTIWSLQLGWNKVQNYIYWALYTIISVFGIIFVFVRTYIVVGAIIDYNIKMHDKLFTKLLQAPINWFHDCVPRGQILNRLTKDLENSINFFWSFNATLRLLFQLWSCIFICILFNWYSIFMFPIMFIIQYYILKFYVKGQGCINRLEAAARSPIISVFSETLNGVTTIRGYEFQEQFRRKFHTKLDDFFKVLLYQNGTSSWFAENLDLISFILLFFVLSFSVLFQNFTSPQAMGLLLTSTWKLIDFTFTFFEKYSQLQRWWTSIERCDSFTQIIQENSFIQANDAKLKSNNFPLKGKLTFENYSVKYRPDTPIVLKNLNFEIQHGEKIGVVGRTGSGKSTLCLCVFRILEPYMGKILIDDVDITTIGWRFLREIITVIPQNPTLIEGTLRANLDPIHKFSDEQIETEMKEIGIGSMPWDMKIEEDGRNISVGERQLICITRAILRKSKIVIMDEATSSIDYKTEMLIQNSIALSLKYSTVITIAHRIKTILNYDRIFVLDNGILVENESPSVWIKSGKGIFYNWYIQSNL